MHTLNKILKNFEKHSGRIGPDVWGNDYLLHECTFGGGGSGKKSEVGYAVSVFGVKDGKEEEDVSRRYMLPVSIDCLFDGLVEPEGDTSDVACGLFCATVEAMGKRKDTKNVYSILTRLIDAYEKARKMPDEERKLITENIVDIIKDMPALEGKEFGYEVRDKSSVSIVGLEQGMYKIGENVLDRTVLGSEAFDYLMQVAMIDRARWFAAAELAYKVDFERASRTFNDIAKRNGPEVKQIVGRKMRYNKDISCFSVLRDAAIV